MGLTKEECVEYLETLRNFACMHTTCCMRSREEIQEDKKLFNECIETFKQLIKEHFDNPPLKFEELEEGMWVWDNEEKWYRKIVILFQPCKEYCNGSFKAWANSCETEKDFVVFEVNRFYRYEVKDD